MQETHHIILLQTADGGFLYITPVKKRPLMNTELEQREMSEN